MKTWLRTFASIYFQRSLRNNNYIQQKSMVLTHTSPTYYCFPQCGSSSESRQVRACLADPKHSSLTLTLKNNKTTPQESTKGTLHQI